MTPAELDALERAFAIAQRAENERDPSARNRRYEAEDLITNHAEALLAMARRTGLAEEMRKIADDERRGYVGQLGEALALAEAAENRTWTQCTSVTNDCLGGCASMREHDRHRHQQLQKERDAALARAEAAEAYATLTRDACRVRLDIRTEERDQFQTALTESRAEVERLRAALSWYAESKNVAPDFHEPEWAAGGSVAKWRPIDEDCGERARAVLAAEVKS